MFVQDMMGGGKTIPFECLFGRKCSKMFVREKMFEGARRFPLNVGIWWHPLFTLFWMDDLSIIIGYDLTLLPLGEKRIVRFLWQFDVMGWQKVINLWFRCRYLAAYIGKCSFFFLSLDFVYNIWSMYYFVDQVEKISTEEHSQSPSLGTNIPKIHPRVSSSKEKRG